ncbi:MAG: NAD(P)-dependent alcohol dehydrogenase [Candidatus Wenzhouxiangella sp. M2_3B_020]
MKAAVYREYGPPQVVRIEEVPTPEPGAGEVLVRVRVTTVSAGDWRLRSMDVPTGFGILSRLAFGLLRPRKGILGLAFAGEVAAVGDGVTAFAPGERVFGQAGDLGAHAEYLRIAADGPVVKTPAGLDDEAAAALPFGGTTALFFLRKAEIAAGESALVNGASGEVGSAAVQLARHFGAKVTAVCSGGNADLVRDLGADRVIDYSQEDVTRGDARFDVIVDTAGTASYGRSKGILAPGGRLVQILGGLPDMVRAPFVGWFTDKRVIVGVAPGRAEDLRFLADLAVAGDLRPVIVRRFAFDEIVEAHRYVDSGHKVGTAIVTVTSNP